MKSITIYTPINHDYEALIILMSRLSCQTNKDFVWYIINWGDRDIDDMISQLRENSNLDIEYHKIEAKGKFIVTQFVFEHAKTNYILGCPCEFILKKNAIDVIIRQWREVQNKSLNLAEVRALCEDKTGNIVGKTDCFMDVEFLDATWHDMVLKKHTTFHMISSWDVLKFRECVKMSDFKMFQDKYNELSTSLFWSAIGNKYKTRYIFKSIARINSNIQTNVITPNKYNAFVASYYMFIKNIKYFFYNPFYFIRLFIHIPYYLIKTK